MARSSEVFHFKILIIGESSVGKSSLMTRFVDETFQPSFVPTIGVDFKVRTMMIDDYQCKVQIWDTAGQERFRVITTTYYRDAAGVLIVYDVTNGESFFRIRRWIDEINKYCDENIAKVLIGNKDDNPSSDSEQSPKIVSTADAEQYARQMNLTFFETSAKDNKNVNEAFYALTRLALHQRLNAQAMAHHPMTNGTSAAQAIRLKGAGKSKKKNKKHTGACYMAATTKNLEGVQTFKILIIGDSGVGKSSLMVRFVDDIFTAAYITTIGVDFKMSTINVDGHQCRIQIWDTAGQERFRVITSTYYRGADGVIIVYDVTNGDSFANLKDWITEMERHCDKTVPKILVGNKDDNDNELGKVVLTSDARAYAEQKGLPFFETSAKDNKNIAEAFNEITRLALKRRLIQPNSGQPSTGTTRIGSKRTVVGGTQKKCCTS
ncbi:unnamed protein product [Adineta ricciae]|uniref:Uncharacterized protein n=1 Tax=Adineta ricciae TaxID=249248 RepID=A0A813Z6D3_ADIRI|nr:unnamed protein product [Adineta ricciae]